MKQHATSFSLNLPYDLNIDIKKIKEDQLLGFKSTKHIKHISNLDLETPKSKNKINRLSINSPKNKEKIKEKVLEKFDSKKKTSIKSKTQKNTEKDSDKAALSERYEEHVKRISETYKNNPDFLNLIEIIDFQKQKISKLELQSDKRKKNKPKKNERVISDLKKDNSKLLGKLLDYKKMFDDKDWEFLLNKVEESTKVIKKLSNDKTNLSKELSDIKNSPVFANLNDFMHDIFKIRNDITNLLRTIDNFYQGKEFVFKSFMEINMESFSQPAVQISSDLETIKRDLNRIFGLISDIYAGHCADSVCKTQ